MRQMIGLFTHHPRTVNESYFEHLATALSFSASLLGAGLACLVHAIFPFLFANTGSKAIAQLHDRMVTNRTTQPN